MTWTYTSTNLANSSMDTVRLRIGDNSTGDQLLQNEEITYVLDNITTNVVLASAECCDLIAAKYSRQADTTNEGLSVRASQRAEAYRKMAKDLRKDAYKYGEIFFGGRSKQTKEDRAGESDLVQPYFTRDQDDYEGTIASTTE